MKLGTETGSLINHLMSRSGIKAEPGMGATILMWTDREPATIVKVTPTQVHVRCDSYKRTDNRGYFTEDQDYEYEEVPANPVVIFRLTKRGLRCKSGNYLRVGQREAYRDPSF